MKRDNVEIVTAAAIGTDLALGMWQAWREHLQATKPHLGVPTLDHFLRRLQSEPAHRGTTYVVQTDGSRSVKSFAEVSYKYPPQNSSFGRVSFTFMDESATLAIQQLIEGVRNAAAVAGLETVSLEQPENFTNESILRQLGCRHVATTNEYFLESPTDEQLVGPRSIRDGMRLRKWIGNTPDEIVDVYASIKSQINDAPAASKAKNVRLIDPNWIRAEEVRMESTSLTRFTVVLSNTDGTIAALCDGYAGDYVAPHFAHLDTIVDRPSRENGLGYLVKRSMVDWLVSELGPEVTFTAKTSAANIEMNQLNLRLGYSLRYEQKRWDMRI